MPYRYDSRSIRNISKFDMFKQIKTLRKTDSVNIFSTPKFKKPSDEVMEQVDFDIHTWTRGDSFYRLSHTHYGDTKYWWVIALFNNTPTEHHVEIGDQILIPDNPVLLSNVMRG